MTLAERCLVYPDVRWLNLGASYKTALHRALHDPVDRVPDQPRLP